ncbi:FAD-dependent oxidoreductase [Candidatus Endoriftia persephone]|uniref:FAD-dependent oxidoreductase n=1 Tax=Candidatus Endoriftia persephonae TaxID=393765 RepID=A0A9J7A1P5_9GAMM|nr:FAD-dependent oxidoreductase [Candidatus Endoriftia persephone]USF88696.1 FAD-dependent oxidoreductase [Candidatus Endoriftia persephone]
MNPDTQQEPLLAYSARPNTAARQDTLPGRYRWWVMAISMAAFSLAFVGWLNESWLYLFESPIWLNRYTEYAIILAFGLWRIRAEQNPYTRKRLIILVTVVTGFWWLIPWLMPMFEPYAGYVWSQPVFPALHTPGTLTFFLTLLLVFLFGRRIICGFGCPCVGVRETVGFPFRRFSLRGDWAWRLRHTKWFFFIWYVGVMVATQFPPNAWTATLVGMFALVVGLTYFGTFFITPITGNRFYCRYLCPFGATFGLLNHAGFFGIKMDPEQCIDCRRCEQACDMGIPVWQQGKTTGEVTSIEDCMGCARCIISCPTDALEIRDVRNLFRPNLRQDAGHLLKRKSQIPAPRTEPAHRPAAVRLSDWNQAEKVLSTKDLQRQAERCLDCGVPGCRNACPLGNFIPDWLEAAARGDWKKAGDLAHATSPLPEVCGRICPQHRLCEGACTRTQLEGAVTIGAIERTLAERALDEGWRPIKPAQHNGRKVTIIGAGPAGLSCAERLNRMGVEVTVYDRSTKIGGLLQTGVPAFKLDKTLLARRQTLLEQAGIRFSLGLSVDAAMLSDLLGQNDAIFLGLGAQKPRTIELPGQTLPGVEQALSWLKRINAGEREPLTGQQLLVLGGGDTAMDCARAALRLGAEVTVAYRGPEARLRASPKEITLAREEGAQFLFNHAPLECKGSGGVTGVRFETHEGATIIEANRVILALGQQADPPPWLATFDIVTESDGRIQVDTQGHTSHPKIWAGGDNTLGPDLAVTAMAAGRKAAEGMLSSFSLWRRIRKQT